MNSVFNDPVDALGNYVTLKTIDINDDMMMRGLYVPQKAAANYKLGTYEVISVGKNAYEQYGLEPGMIVSVDRLACHGWRTEYPLVKYESVIFQKIDDKVIPMKGQLIVEELPAEETPLLMSKKSNLGKVVAVNGCETISEGDTVLLTQGADVIGLNGKTYFIYKEDMIIAKYK